MRFCEECGAQLEDGVKFCEECGAEVEELVIDEVPVEKTDIEETVEAENMVQPAVQKEKAVPKAESKPEKSGKPMKKGLLFGIIGAVLVVILAVVLILVLGGEKKDDSRSKKEKDKQVEEDISEKDAEDEENKDNSTGDSAVEKQEEKVSIFDVGFGGEFSGGTYSVECDDGFGMWLNYSPMGSSGYIHDADWSSYAYFDLYEDICFDTEYSFFSEGTNAYGVWYMHTITFTVQRDGIWLYWYYYQANQIEGVLYDGFISSENITCSSNYVEYESSLEANQRNTTSLSDKDSKYVFRRIDGGEIQSVGYASGYWEDEYIALTKYFDEENTTYVSVQNKDWDYVYFETNEPIYYGEEFVFMGECFEGPEDYYWEELDYTTQSNGEKVYDTSKYDEYTEVRILVNDAGIDVYWCDHSKSGTTVRYDGLFEAEWVERTIDIKNY